MKVINNHSLSTRLKLWQKTIIILKLFISDDKERNKTYHYGVNK